MTKEDAEKLELGAYRIYWIYEKNSSVGVISMDCSGSRRLQCSNWSSTNASFITDHLDSIERVELLSNQKGDKGELATAWKMIRSLTDQVVKERDRNVMRQYPDIKSDDDPNYSTTPFQLAGTQPPSKTLMELAYGEEAELIRAATQLVTCLSSSDPMIGPAREYLINKFKGEPDAESD